MIEVFAKLDRGTVYLAGESIEGQVTFTNKGNHIHKYILKKFLKFKEFQMTLAWIQLTNPVQILCILQCQYNLNIGTSLQTSSIRVLMNTKIKFLL